MKDPIFYNKSEELEKLPDVTQRKLLHRTHFRRSATKSQGWQWFWSKVSPNGKDTIAVGGEGYDERLKAFNGYFAAEGFPEWEPYGELTIPEGYVIQNFANDHWTITKYGIE